MSGELAELSILPSNKTVVFYSPVGGKDVLVRTGTVLEDSSFLNALLHAYSTEYVSMNVDERDKFVKKNRSSISRIVGMDGWEGLSDGLTAIIPFQEKVKTLIFGFYRYILRGGTANRKSIRKIIRSVIKDEKVDTETYKLITEMIPYTKGFENIILPLAYKYCSKDKVTKCKKYIVEHSVKYYKKEFDKLNGHLEDESVQYYLDKLELLVQTIVDEAEYSSYNEYIESIQDTCIEVNAYNIGLISEKFNRDIYLIDSSTRMPYNYTTTNNNIHKRKSIILMWISGCHYEVVGRLLSGNRIQREFDFDDPLIKCIYTYMYMKESIPKEYPDLIKYLKKFKLEGTDYDESLAKSNKNCSDSEEDFDNSSEYAYEQSDSEDDEPFR
jgi:hypothetical protein